MRDHLRQQLEKVPLAERRNRAREYLQVYLLRQLHEDGDSVLLGFVGGTALRLLYGLPRFSEDLGFSYTPRPDNRELQPTELFRRLKKRLEGSGYAVSVKAKTQRLVANAFFRFPGLPAEIGVASDPRLALTIKLEIDTNPPAGARIETTLVQRFFPIALRHHDLPSLFAGKLHAILTRAYAKGRDWFDLAWYLTEKRSTLPNIALLRSALIQTGHRHLEAERWPTLVLEKLRQLDWRRVESDLRPFVERESDLGQIKPDLIAKLLG